MKLLIITGPQAVGKMTVGQEIEKRTKLKLFHNHMTIDLVSNFFSYDTVEGQRLVDHFRYEIFKEVAKSDMEGIIFTVVWAFDDTSNWEYIESIADIFKKQNGEIYYVELESDLETRLERNKTPNRLEHKPSKRDIAWNEEHIIESMNKYRLNSNPGEVKLPNYIKINNNNKSASEVAEEVIGKFNL